LKKGVDRAEQRALPFTVDDSHLVNALFEAGPEVLIHDGRRLTGAEGVKIQLSLDGTLYFVGRKGLVRHIFSRST
jgi:hypothetical protein